MNRPLPDDQPATVTVPPLSPWSELTPASAPLGLEAREVSSTPGSFVPPSAAEMSAGEALARELPEADFIRLLHRRRRRRPVRLRRVETHWYQCLAYPVLAFGSIALFAAALTWITVGLVAASAGVEVPVAAMVIIYVALPAPFVVMFCCGFLQCVLASAVAGEPPRVYWPGPRHLVVASGSLCRWLFCCVAGPAQVLWLATWFWIHAGELAIWDRLILAQLFVVAVSYGLFALLAVTCTDRLADANPRRVLETVRTLGYRAAVLIALVGVLGVLLLLPLGEFTAEVHHHLISGWILFGMWWLCALGAAAFVLRLTGVWAHQVNLRGVLAGTGPRDGSHLPRAILVERPDSA